MKNSILVLISALLFISFACKRITHCPKERVITSETFPEKALEFNPYQDVNELIFMNETLETMTFSLVTEREGIRTHINRSLDCEENENRIVDLYFEGYYYYYEYATTEGDTIKLSYYPSLINFRRTYKHIEEPHISFYLSITIDLAAFPDEDVSFGKLLYSHTRKDNLIWEILESYEFMEIIHYDIYTFNKPNFFYNKKNGIVGFKDSGNRNWILKE